MIGLTSRTTSPSSVVSSRSTPWVAGWCGPKLMVRSSSCRSSSTTASVPETGSSSIRSIVTERSRSRYGTLTGSKSVIPARVLALVEGVEDGLAAHREVAPLGVALVVLRHQDAAMVRVAVEHDAEHVVDLALLVIGGGEQVDDRGEPRIVGSEPGLDVEAVGALHGEELVVHAEARLLGEVVAAVHAHQGGPRLVVLVAQVCERVADGRRGHLKRRLAAEEGCVGDRLVAEPVAYALGDQLEARGIRQGRSSRGALRCRTRCTARATHRRGCP